MHAKMMMAGEGKGPVISVPGSFFLAANDGDYRGNVAYVRAMYHW